MQRPTDPSSNGSKDGDERQIDPPAAVEGDGEIGRRTGSEKDSTGNTNAVPEAEDSLPLEKMSGPETAAFAAPATPAEESVRQLDLSRLPDMIDLMRRESDQKILVSLFTAGRLLLGPEIEHNGRRHWVPPMPRGLYRSLVLPTKVQGSRSASELFTSILALLKKHATLPAAERSLVTYWSMATWFPDYLPFFPSLRITGHPTAADLLLRTLAVVCRRPVLLADVSPAALRVLPLGELTPTLLIRGPQLSTQMSALLDASSQPGYLISSGKDFQQFYCPKCIYVGEYPKGPLTAASSIQVHVGGSAPWPLHPLPCEDVVKDFQNRLLTYRLLGREKVASSRFRVSAFRPEVSATAEALGAAIVDDPELQREITGLLQAYDEQSRVDRASGQNGVVLRAVLLHCHQADQEQVFVRDIAATANQLYSDDGESLKLSNEAVGHVLKSLGLYSRRLGSAGRGLVLDKETRSRVHRLGQAYEVLPAAPVCNFCHMLQTKQSKVIVQDV